MALADPDWIAVPIPVDMHPDHCATFTFLLAALKSLAAEPGGDSKIPDRLLTYLVHDGWWPPPPSVPGPLPLPPVTFPPARWYSLPLDAAQIDAKLAALESHGTQAAMMDRLFRALARPNEIFAVVERPDFARLKPGEPPCGPELAHDADASGRGKACARAVSDAATRSPSAARRLRFLDTARALAVVAMLVANLVNVFAAERPYWLGHNLGDELLPLDLPAPIFQFLIGFSLVLFLERRGRQTERRRARWLAARRFLLLVALGVVLDAVAAQRVEIRWGVLQTLGMGGIVAVALSELPDALIVAIAAVITATHYGPGNNEVHRSLLDCLPFMPITLIGYVVGRPLAKGDLFGYERRAVTVALGGLTLAVALRLAGVPFNKVIGTSSFVLLAIAASASLIAALSRLEVRGWRFPDPLVRLGASALTAWVLQYLLVYYPIIYVFGPPPALPEAGGLAAVAACVVALAAVTLALARRGIRVPI